VGVAADTGVEVAMGAETEAGGAVGVALALATLAGWMIAVLMEGAAMGAIKNIFKFINN